MLLRYLFHCLHAYPVCHGKKAHATIASVLLYSPQLVRDGAAQTDSFLLLRLLCWINFWWVCSGYSRDGYSRDEPSRALDPIRHPNGSEISNLKPVWISSTIHQTACCGLRNGGLQWSGYWVGLERSFSLKGELKGKLGFLSLFFSIWLDLSLTSQY